MTSVEWLPSAVEELAAASNWYDAEQAGLGADFIEEIDAVVAAIGLAPRSFPRWSPRRRFRKAIVGNRFPYVLFFEELGHRVIVHALAHMHRQPGYWMSRRITST